MALVESLGQGGEIEVHAADFELFRPCPVILSERTARLTSSGTTYVSLLSPPADFPLNSWNPSDSPSSTYTTNSLPLRHGFHSSAQVRRSACAR